MEETKPLTLAQRTHLRQLYAEKERVEGEINRFVAYLANEHQAPSSEGWKQIDVDKGFVRTVPTGT